MGVSGIGSRNRTKEYIRVVEVHGSGSIEARKIEPQVPDPNPYKYKILQRDYIGPYTILKVLYEGCTTFNSIKIMVYKDLPEDALDTGKPLDPHFFDDVSSPIARFRGNAEGFDFARKFILSLRNPHFCGGGGSK